MSPAFRALTLVRLPRPCNVRYMARTITSTSKAPLLVTPDALQQLRSTADVNILDASWFMPNTPRDASKEFIEKRIPDARYLDLDEVAEPSEFGFKHMMPSSQVFAEALGTPIGNPIPQLRANDHVEKFGITPTSHVVL
jgi:thiosulfate/3-mercaptopyruvate sulfurtransferase